MKRTEEEIRTLAREMIDDPSGCYQRIVGEYYTARGKGNVPSGLDHLVRYMEQVQGIIAEETLSERRRLASEGGRWPREAEEIIQQAEDEVAGFAQAYLIGYAIIIASVAIAVIAVSVFR